MYLTFNAARARNVASAVIMAALAGCGGNGGGSSTPTAAAPQGQTAPVDVAPMPTFGAADAVRLSKQASFGPTQPLTDHVQSLGLDTWLNEQFAASGSTYIDFSGRAVARDYCTANFVGTAQSNCNRDYLSSIPVAMRFYADAVGQPDQLRQRVAFALSQIVVASDFEVHSTAGLAVFNQIFLNNAFGNYRDILKSATLNPYMGGYLNMADSAKATPNENYARELMQLFSIGVTALNMDGTAKKDANGAPIASYNAAEVHDVARALTGWTYARLNGAPLNDNNQYDYAHPMVMIPANYDTAAKNFLGTTVAAGATQDVSVNAVVDAVFNNASTAPNISKSLIQQLVTSNPTPAYVKRVSTVFADNGSGVRGDLKAVVRAILTDAEARGNTKPVTFTGKVKEPVLLSLGIARLAGFRSDGYAFVTRDSGMGQAPFRSPSVFNFYPPDYPLPQGGGLLSPPSKLITTATAISRHNLVYDWTVTGDAASRPEYAVYTPIAGSTGTQPDWSSWEALGTDTEGLLTRVNLLLLNNTMTTAQRDAVRKAVLAVTNADPATQARKRAQVALYIVATSPQFQVDR